MSTESVMSITDAFKARQSVRNFTGQLPAEKLEIIQKIVEEANKISGPFGKPGEISITEPGIGRFGMAGNEAGWIVMKVPKDITDEMEYKKCALDAAFKANIAVMRMVQNGFSACWMAGTFNHGIVESRFPGFKVPCTVVFGIDAEKKRFLDKAIAFVKGRDRMES